MPFILDASVAAAWFLQWRARRATRGLSFWVRWKMITKPAGRDKTDVAHRAEDLDSIAAVLPIERRDELAELLTDQDVETLRHLVNKGTGDNTLRALTSDLPICRPGRFPPPALPCPGPRQRRCS